MSKRAFDLFVTTFLLFTALPLLCLLGFLIWLDSGRPVFFLHKRVGRHGRLFCTLKLRTMVVDTEPYAPGPSSLCDAHITRMGRFLRHTSLDELPQLLNVLKGDMSLVGPRPEMPFLVARYSPVQRRRLSVRPGMTGLWQVNGRKDIPLTDNIRYDFYYIRRHSLRLDMMILLRTVPAVCSRRGAY